MNPGCLLPFWVPKMFMVRRAILGSPRTTLCKANFAKSSKSVYVYPSLKVRHQPVAAEPIESFRRCNRTVFQIITARSRTSRTTERSAAMLIGLCLFNAHSG